MYTDETGRIEKAIPINVAYYSAQFGTPFQLSRPQRLGSTYTIIIIMIATMIVYVTTYHTYHDRSIGVIGMIGMIDL